MSDLLPIHSVPLLRKLWLVITLTCLLITMPIAMIILLTGPVYRRKPDGYQPISNRARYAYGGILVLWLIAATIHSVSQPGGIKGQWERSADPDLAKTESTPKPGPATGGPKAAGAAVASASADNAQGLPSCTDPQVMEAAKGAIEESPAGTNLGLRIVDVGKGQETYYDPQQNVRRCVAEAMLNNGRSLLTFQVLTGPSGKVMIQAQVGQTAAMQYEVDKSRKEEAERAALEMVRKAVPPDQDSAGKPAEASGDQPAR